MTATRLAARALLRLSPDSADENVVDFVQGLVTQDVAGELPVWAGLLTPQGKVLFDFLVWDGGAGALLIDCESEAAEALAKRLSLYRLRRRITIAVDPALAVHWSATPQPGATPDPRLPELGWRWLGAPGGEPADAAWRTHRLTHGVTEGRAELGNGETLWLECNADALNGVSFTKGCYVGQENTARMNWRQKVNRRLRVTDAAGTIERARVEDVPPAAWPAWLQTTISAAS